MMTIDREGGGGRESVHKIDTGRWSNRSETTITNTKFSLYSVKNRCCGRHVSHRLRHVSHSLDLVSKMACLFHFFAQSKEPVKTHGQIVDIVREPEGDPVALKRSPNSTMLVSISTAVLVDIGTFATIKVSSKRCEDGSSPRGATRIECAVVV